jgi:hypothetical protein
MLSLKRAEEEAVEEGWAAEAEVVVSAAAEEGWAAEAGVVASLAEEEVV